MEQNIGKKLSEINLPTKLKGIIRYALDEEVLVEVSSGWRSGSAELELYGIPLNTQVWWFTKEDVLGIEFAEDDMYEALPDDYDDRYDLDSDEEDVDFLF